jgi:pentatricopeptide repeat protein
LKCYCAENGDFVLLWYLWREMNDRNFEDRERNLEEIKFVFFFDK